jgi:PQQ-like domain
LRFRLMIWFTICLLLGSSGVGLESIPALTAPAITAANNADWPQLGHDPQRSNATPQAVSGPYRFYWRWTSVPLASRIQPVVANNRLFIGSLTGRMYALDAGYDAQGGSPRTLWQHDLGSPIRAGAAVDGDIVVVGVHHGMIYGLDAATGLQRWSFATAGAILSAPLISAGVAYIGSADGWYYALRTSDGSLIWKTDVGVPVLSSAALSSDGGKLYFVAENVQGYALATSNGAIVWQAQLQGQSGADRWPVVLQNLVIFRTMPLRFFHDLLHDGDDVMDRAGARQNDWGADWAAVRPQIIQHLNDTPADQTLFALDANSGQARGTAPMLYTFGNNDPPAPPVVYNNALYVPYRARHGIQNDSSGAIHVTSRYDAELGRIDATSLDISGLTNASAFDYQFRLTSDEPAILSMAGDLLLVDSWERLGGISMSNESLVGIAQVAWDYPECYVQCASNHALMPFYESYPFPSPHSGEGGARAGAIAAAGRIFWKVGPSGLAAIGPANRMSNSGQITTPAPLPKPAHVPSPCMSSTTRSVPIQALRDYVWDEPVRPITVPVDLQLRLRQAVEQIVSKDQHLLPFFLERGFHGVGSWPPDTTNPPEPAHVYNSEVYWFDPGELIMTLSLAYPYLDASLQAQTSSYLRAEMERYPPLEPLPYQPPDWLTQGRAREPYPTGSRDGWDAWPPPDVSIQTLYALWAYGRYNSDWSYLSTRWQQISALFDAKKTAIDSYAEIAGAIGYARIARQLGHNAAADQGEAAAVSALQAGLNFNQWRDRANNLYPDPRDLRTGQRGQVFWGLTPEVGQYLKDTNLATIQANLRDIVGYPDGSYLWYITRLGIQAERGESSYHSPELAWSIFLTQAYVIGASQTELRYWLDRPWGLGDLWYLQKLIATMEAPVGTTSPLNKTHYVPIVIEH